MGGIAGIFHVETAKPVEEARVRAMLAPMRHRGPDGSGIWSAPGTGLGHLRLSIIDPGDGAQPMATPEGEIVVTFNGEIYNFRELRAELEARGHHFRTQSDTEVILHGWRQWGEAVVERLHGMFAFALHDARTQSLWLVRDRLGVKPLHYASLADGSLIFASELKGLLAHPLLRRAPELTAIEDYLAPGYVPDDSAVVRGVNKLGAGEALLAIRGRSLPAPRRYWDISFADRAKGKQADLEAELLARLRDAVRSRMAADVPLGAMVSGSVDSSIVAALMAEASSKPVTTCTIGFDAAALDEAQQAERIARRFGTDHRTRVASPDDFGLIDTVAAHFDEPFADASALAIYRVCERTRESVRVALCGDGADEGFAGHRRHLVHHREQMVRRLIPAPVRRHLFGALAADGAEAYATSVCVTPAALRAELFTDGARAGLSGHRAEDRYVKAMREAPVRDPIDRAQYADLKIWLPGGILTRMDRMSMAVGLEAREPLLDHRLIEFAARLPVRQRIHGRSGKYLLKKTMEPMLPLDILYRPKPRIVTPISDWFSRALASEARALAGGSALARTEWFDMRRIARLAEAHRSGASDHGRLLWQLLMLDKALSRLFNLG